MGARKDPTSVVPTSDGGENARENTGKEIDEADDSAIVERIEKKGEEALTQFRKHNMERSSTAHLRLQRRISRRHVPTWEPKNLDGVYLMVPKGISMKALGFKLKHK